MAHRDITVSEPITWNYGGNLQFLEADYVTRNYAMVNNMRFVCRCPRCRSARRRAPCARET